MRALAMLLAPAAELIDASASAGPSPIAHAQRAEGNPSGIQFIFVIGLPLCAISQHKTAIAQGI